MADKVDLILLFFSFACTIIAVSVHILGIIGLLKLQRRWAVQHYLFLNLSISNILWLSSDLPIQLYLYHNQNLSYESLSKFKTIYKVLFTSLSISTGSYYFTLIGLTVDRLIAISKPWVYRDRISSIAFNYGLGSITFAWIVPCVVTIPIMVMDPKSNTMLTGPSAPALKSLEQWLLRHPTYHVVMPTSMPSSRFYGYETRNFLRNLTVDNLL